MTSGSITVFLADDNLIVREGVRALLELEGDIEVVGVAADFDELIDGAVALNPNVVVTDIRMPPHFRREGIDAAAVVRKRHPGTGVVILSQFDDPEYAISLLAEGAAGYAYLLKDRVGEGDQLAAAVREVAGGGSVLDPTIVDALAGGVAEAGWLSPQDDVLLQYVAEGRPIKAIATALRTTPGAVDSSIAQLFVRLAEGLSAGQAGSLERLKRLHEAILRREEQGETLSRFLPAGIADQLRDRGRRIGETEEVEVTVVISDIRSYSAIAEKTPPTTLAGQLNEHRAAMNHAIHEEGGSVMQFVGDAVMAVFGAPITATDHADRAVRAAARMHEAQGELNGTWRTQGRQPFRLGIGVSTGIVASLLLGSEDRIEYTVVGDTVNLAQRVQQWAEPGETVLTKATRDAITPPLNVTELPPAKVKGREAPVVAYKLVDPS
ncbi:MAG TPA: adenylate/guanylate cyclase domain-containing protein [Acidimicrobiia bacterium]|nr:adenylate/guanylate cyclase domain-containing protein [Acidimicrobiia bacterium]